ncbi:MAG: NTP transferase domain-containing protein, partial [Planctomycetota bacterium]|nr:NTP transferase domain-containing protein [Planctomycetota bacterium]
GVKARQSSHYLLWPVDIPLVNKATVQELWQSCQRDHDRFDLWIPSIHQRRGHPIIFNEELAQDILNQGPDASLRGLFENRRISHVEVEDEAILWDLNTPEAAQQARAKLCDS